MIRRPPRSTQGVSSAASDVYKRQCPYLPKSKGGDASELNKDVCMFAIGGARKVLGCPEDEDDELPMGLIIGVAVAALVAVLGVIATCVLITRERAGKPMFAKLDNMA